MTSDVRISTRQSGVNFEAAPAIETNHSTWKVDKTMRWHTHTRHKLMWGFTGRRTVQTATATWVLPPTAGLWIPAHVLHAGFAGAGSSRYSTYVDTDLFPSLWDEPTPVAILPVVREMILYLAVGSPTSADRAEMEQMVLRLITPLATAGMTLPMPLDDRAKKVAAAIAADPADDRITEQWAAEIGVTGRTLDRLFVSQTGMTVSQWRAQARVRTATTLLVNGQPVADVAHQVGYKTSSAFVRAFRQITGKTPRAYAEEIAPTRTLPIRRRI